MSGGSVPGLTGGNLAGGGELAELGTKENGTAVANASAGGPPSLEFGLSVGAFATLAGCAFDAAGAFAALGASTGSAPEACSDDSALAIARCFLCRTACMTGCCSTCCGCAAGGGVGMCRWMGSSVSVAPGSCGGGAASGEVAGTAGAALLGDD